MKKIEVTNIVIDGFRYDVAAVVDAEGYFASRCGRVFSNRSKNRLREIGYLNESKNRMEVRIPFKNGYRSYSRSRAVCSAFTGVSIFSKLHCLHLDGNPLNDHIENLEFGTVSDNMRDRSRHGRQPFQKLLYSECREIIRLYETGKFTQKALGEMFGVAQPNIYYILKNHREDPDYYTETEYESTVLQNAG